MIIEIFGPPCSGKTTLARALAKQLSQSGLDADLALSYRPSELSAEPGAQAIVHHRIVDAGWRLARPIFETLTSVGEMFGESRKGSTAAALLELLPPDNFLTSVRLRQYIWRRSHVWKSNCGTGQMLIFDQAFVQVIYSLAALQEGVAYQDRLARSLDCIPKPDFLIRLHAPRETLEMRLAQRRRDQSAIERLLDLNTNLDSIEIIDQITDLLESRGQSVTWVSCIDEASLRNAVAELERQTIERFHTMAVAA